MVNSLLSYTTYSLLFVGVVGWNYALHGSDWIEGVCETALNQSPRNIQTSSAVNASSLWYLDMTNYEAATFSSSKGISYSLNNYFNLTGSLGNATKKGTGASDLGTIYTLNSIQFHTPSEHSLNGIYYDLEAQVYHTSNADGSYLIVSVLFSKINDTDYTMKFFTDLSNANSTGSTQVNPLDLFEGYLVLKQFYYYEGSENIPSCTPAQWLIYDTPIQILDKQVAAFTNLLKADGFSGNTRAQQPNTDAVSFFYQAFEYSSYIVLSLAYLLA